MLCTTWLLFDRFPFRFRRSFGEDFAAVHVVERLAKLGARAGAAYVAPHLFQERELLGARIEGDEVDLHGAVALAEDLTRHVDRRTAARVLSVGHDEQVLAERAGAIEVGPRGTQRLADGGAAAGARQPVQRVANRSLIVRANRAQPLDVAREAVDADFDRQTRSR